MSSHEATFKDRQTRALKECRSSIDWFKKEKKQSRILFRLSQVSVVALSTLTPVLILVTQLPKWAQALPAALAAIAATLSNLFHWQENWVRRASTLQALEVELVRYETRTSSAYDVNISDHQALNNFVENMTRLNLNEVSNWGRVQNKKSEIDR
jgi:putative flippase GtrA